MSTDDRRSGRGGRIGTVVLATALGVGVGLLAAPQRGSETRRALRRRLAAAREGLGEGLEELGERSRPLRQAVRSRAEELRRRRRKRHEESLDELEDELEELEDEDDVEEDEEGSGFLGTVLTIAAGLGAAYFLTSERAAPARERVREAAATVRDEAEARWEQFQRRRGNGQAGPERGAGIDSASSPQAS